MSKKTPEPNIRFLLGILLGGSITFIGLAMYMFLKNEGSPVFFVALAGAGFAAAVAIVASRAKIKS